MDENKKMKWQKDLEEFYDIYNSFIFEGYIDDDQPYEDANGEIKYCRLYDYFDKVYSNHAEPAKRKRVIIYDPTEAVDKRFKICDEDYYQEIVENNGGNGNGESNGQTDRPTRTRMRYMSSEMSQHFWDILHDEELDKLLIDHKSSGVSLDFSKIHYAVTEAGDRLAPFERLEKFSDIFQLLFGSERNPNEPNGYLFVIKMTSRLLTRDGESRGLSGDELMIFRQLLNIAQSLDVDSDNAASTSSSKLVVLANKVEDLPGWFADETANPYIKLINVARPSEENILDFFQTMLDSARSPGDTPKCFTEDFIRRYDEIDRVARDRDPNMKRNPIQKKFLAYTNDFGMKMLRRYKAYLENSPLDDPAKIGYSVSSFRLGKMINPWDDEARIREMLDIKRTVSRKIKGQDHALETAQAILTRAALGLDRAENPNAPRVVLFLAGPTGTGKTELCKQIAESIFGSEERIVRFDMSEYGQEESDQKLFGAPPGYVGYEEGGKLTNAIKKEPFSLVLFDEIEKAHNSILDKFLQILGDGRLTDGKGETVRFTDCIIVITSNAGVTKLTGMNQKEIDSKMNGDKMPEGEMDMDVVVQLEAQKISEGKVDQDNKLTQEATDEIYKAVSEHLRYNVKSYFHCQLGRPELYGRIEDSIVYYNYIGRDSVKDIVESKINNVIKTTQENIDGVSVVCSPEVLNAIVTFCQGCKVRALGARGIIKNTGKLFTGSLSDYLSDYVRGVNGKSKADLNGKTLVCSCDEVIESAKNIRWGFLNE